LAARLRDRLAEGIARLGAECVLISGAAGERFSPFILCASLPGYRAEVLLHHLSRERVYVSSGSACSSHSPKGARSHVLQAMGLPNRVVDGALRFSFSARNALEEADAALAALAKAVREIRPSG